MLIVTSLVTMLIVISLVTMLIVTSLVIILIVTSLVTVRQSHRAASGREAVRTPKATKSSGKTSRQQKVTGGRWRRRVHLLTSVESSQRC